MPSQLEPIAPCCFCGVEESPFLYTTPLCTACARSSQVTFSKHDGQTGIALTCADGRWHWLTWSEDDTPSLRAAWEREWPARVARHALIATGRAGQEDPEFLARIGDYIAQVGWSPSVERALRYEREAGNAQGAVEEAERLLGLRA